MGKYKERYKTLKIVCESEKRKLKSDNEFLSKKVDELTMVKGILEARIANLVFFNDELRQVVNEISRQKYGAAEDSLHEDGLLTDEGPTARFIERMNETIETEETAEEDQIPEEDLERTTSVKTLDARNEPDDEDITEYYTDRDRYRIPRGLR